MLWLDGIFTSRRRVRPLSRFTSAAKGLLAEASFGIGPLIAIWLGKPFGFAGTGQFFTA